MGGVDGLLKVPPHIATDEDLIEHWSPDINYEGLHQSDIDVTGGIGLKISRGHLVAQSGIGVYLINGEYPSEYFLCFVKNLGEEQRFFHEVKIWILHCTHWASFLVLRSFVG